MDQIHKRFTTEQVKTLLRGYCQGTLDRSAIEEMLGISKTRFFAILRQYRHDSNSFSVSYQRAAPTRLSPRAEREIERELLIEKGLVEDSSLPITTYNYSSVRNRLAKHDITVSLSTIIERAKHLGCYQSRSKQKAHDREVVTTAIGTLIQHDASHHRWSPYAEERWVLVTSLDDFSRKILYADLFQQEPTWVAPKI
jgi:hypothetical protein